jgi:ubiquinol-cytochrome c reductase cytochrome c1 subunit
MWAAEPKLEERKQMGAAVLVFLVLFSGLLYASYRRVWRNESH